MDTEMIRLSGAKLKALQGAIPFQRDPSEKPAAPANTPLIDNDPVPTRTQTSSGDPIELESYRKKFRKKSGGDVVQGSAFGYDTDILTNPSAESTKPIDGDVSPL